MKTNNNPPLVMFINNILSMNNIESKFKSTWDISECHILLVPLNNHYGVRHHPCSNFGCCKFWYTKNKWKMHLKHKNRKNSPEKSTQM